MIIKERLTILNLEDSAVDAAVIRETLESEGIQAEILLVATKESFLAALARSGLDLILADYTLPSFDGFSALELARQYSPEVPFIFVTGILGVEIAIRALKSGATDYVLKEHLSLLVPAIHRALEEKRKQKDLRQAEEAVQEMAETIRKSEERYSTVIEEIDEGYYEVDLSGTFTFVNDSMARMMEYSKEEMLGMNYRTINPEDHQKDVFRTYNAVYQTGERMKWYPFYQIKKNGSLIYVLNSIALMRDREGTIVGFRGVSRDISESQRMEEALKESEARYRTIIDEMHEGYYETDLAGNFTFVNKAMSRIFGYPREELVGLNNRDYADEANARKVYEDFKGVYNTGIPAELLDYEIIRKDGSKRFVEASVSLRRDASNKATGFRGVIRDITERKRSEEALQASQLQLSEAMGLAKIVCWEVDPIDNMFIFNDPFYAFCGTTAEREGGYRMAREEYAKRFMHPEDLARFPKRSDENVKKEAPAAVVDLEHRIVRGDGEVRHILARKRIIKDASGRIVKISGANQDITERKQMEEDLRRSEEKYRTIIETLQDGYFEDDLAGNLTFVNDAICRIYGYSREELIGMNYRQYMDEETQKKVVQVYRDLYVTGESIKRIEYEIFKKDGTKVMNESSVALIRDSEGRPVGFRGISRDVTERVEWEKRLLQSKLELEESNRQLQEAVALAHDLAIAAERANAAKSEFLANMSHEIRTPMNGVIGMTGLLLDTKLDPEQKQYAEIVRSSGEALLELINNILDFSKIEARKLDLEMLDFDLRTTLEDMAEMVAVKAQEKGLELTCLVEPEVPSLVRGDPGRLRQVLVNLMANAVKFTQSGEVAIQVGIVSQQVGKVTLKFVVNDTGIGIPEALQAGIFSPFVQGDGSTTRKFGGTGLGLSISKQLVEMMGGEIGLESREGKGSTFWFTAVFTKQDNKSAPPLEVQADLKGVRVLVVDDHPSNRFLLTTLLRSWGCHGEEAAEAQAALIKLHEARQKGEPFQVALLDMAMPEIDGETLASRIKADPEMQSTLLIMVTSLGLRGDAARLRALGFEGYLTKPVRQSHLHACLALALGRAQRLGEKKSEDLITRHTLTESCQAQVRILVAEDNPTNQLVALGILKKLGYRAEAVADGAEAVRTLQEIPYDLVLMDCQMPEMDGYEATQRIRKADSKVLNPRIPIIAMTAYAMKGDEEKCLEAGMNDYLSKPVNPKELSEALSRWIGRSKGKHPSPDQG